VAVSRPAADVLGVVLGSAFSSHPPKELALEEKVVETRFGPQPLYEVRGGVRPAYVAFRHGLPHAFLPHQIPYRALAAAFAEVGCGALLLTSSVGVLDAGVPLHRPLLVSDLLTLDNRLPDGSACTLFVERGPQQGHLVLREGLFSQALSAQLRRLAAAVEAPVAGDVVFGYAGGPRTKTAAENAMWARLGAQVNSMSLGPEVVLANELGIPCAGLVVGHKYSLPRGEDAVDALDVARSLADSREALERIVRAFLARGEPVPFGNELFRFGDATPG
jgi:5'-methylthioadenosine phosphorylase